MTRGTPQPRAAELADAVAAARTRLAAAEAELASLCLAYADARIVDDRAEQPQGRRRGRDEVERPKPGAYAADELSVLMRRSPAHTRQLLARTRRIRAGLPDVARAAAAGVVDGEQLEEIDKAARLAQDAQTLTVLNDEVVEAAATRTPPQLRAWLHRFLARHEPDAAAHRRRVRLADRRVSIAQSVTGIGYVTGEVAAEDAAAIDARLTRLSWALGADDPRGVQQRRSDLFAGLLLGTVVVAPPQPSQPAGSAPAAIPERPDVLEVETIDPDTGEYLGTHQVVVDGEGEPVTDPAERSTTVLEGTSGSARIGVVVPLSALLGLDDTPGELPDRSATVPAQVVRDIAARLGTRFTALITDRRGHLLDLAELGYHASARLAEAIRIRAGTCAYPTCTVPAERCDLDHHLPYPTGPTSAANLDPMCRHHHRGKTFAGLAAHRDRHTVHWTLPTAHRYACHDEPLPAPPVVIQTTRES